MVVRISLSRLVLRYYSAIRYIGFTDYYIYHREVEDRESEL